MTRQQKVAVIGLGYVGLPLALAFGRKLPTIGFDISRAKVAAYRQGLDPSNEMSPEQFKLAEKICFTTEGSEIGEADFVVVAVPTPVDNARIPDLAPVIRASETAGTFLKRGAIVVYESTVYPGVTEDVCVPILEKFSGKKCGVDFKVGYSPERINPGDREHTLEKIVKVVAGQDKDSLEKVAWLYSQVVDAGIYKAESIKVAEAAKVIENTQRDLNIALMNELAIIFHKIGIDTMDVIRAASTKWNFLPFRPGLVGGHCIGVDPYYLTYKAQSLGYNPEVILAGRRINDNMGKYIAEQTVKRMLRQGKQLKNAKVLVMGLTFKENCPDIRNSKVIDIVNELKEFGITPLITDPCAESEEAKEEYGIELLDFTEVKGVDAVVAAVAHKEFLQLDPKAIAGATSGGVPFVDVKAAFDREALVRAGFEIWRL